MNIETRHLLLDVNRRFYAQKADAFGASRRWPWPGWQRLVDAWFEARSPHSSAPLRIYDVGCGNGRFGAFLLRRLKELGNRRPVHYLGVDVEPGLLDQALDALEPLDAPDTPGELELDLRILDLEHTAPSEGIDGEHFDLVVCFGVLHHVPGRAQRLALVDDLARCLAPSTSQPAGPPRGWLAVSRWMLHHQPHFERKCRDFAQLEPPPEADQLEPGDTLLGWQHDPDALRYLAFPDDEECALHDRRPGLELLDGYRSDGQSGEDNRYWVWRRASSHPRL